METSRPQSSARKTWIITILICLVLVALGGGLAYFKISSSRVYTDTAIITAPTTVLAPTTAGVLEALYVNEGDMVPANTPVARIGDEILKTDTESLVINVQNDIGMIFNPGQAVVTVINPADLRVDGQIEQDKGLNQIQVGDPAEFTVDGISKTYYGVVDEISPTSHASDVVFNISDEREVSIFDVKVRFDVNEYPELKNGMSAKLWVYKQ